MEDIYISTYGVLHSGSKASDVFGLMTYTEYVQWTFQQSYVDSILISSGSPWTFGLNLIHWADVTESYWIEMLTSDYSKDLLQKPDFNCMVMKLGEKCTANFLVISQSLRSNEAG